MTETHDFMPGSSHARMTLGGRVLHFEQMESGRFVPIGTPTYGDCEEWARLIFISIAGNISCPPPGYVHNSGVIPEGWMDEAERRYRDWQRS